MLDKELFTKVFNNIILRSNVIRLIQVINRLKNQEHQCYKWSTILSSTELLSFFHYDLIVLKRIQQQYSNPDVKTIIDEVQILKYACQGAARGGNISLLKTLVQLYPKDNNNNGGGRVGSSKLDQVGSFMDQAIIGGDMNVIRYLRDHYNSNNRPKSTPLHPFKSEITSLTLDICQCLAGEDRIIEMVHYFANQGHYFYGCIPSAAAKGYLQLIKSMKTIVPHVKYGNAFDIAAEHGHFEIVKYLHELKQLESPTELPKYVINCTSSAMNLASRNGHLNIVKFLHSNRTEGTNVNAVDEAVRNGHSHVAAFLLNNRSEGYRDAFRIVISKGFSHPCFELLNSYTPIYKGTPTLMELAVGKSDDDIKMVKFLLLNRPNDPIGEAIDLACQFNKLDILQLIHSHRTEKATIKSINWAAKHGNVKMFRFLVDHYTPSIDTPMLDELSFFIEDETLLYASINGRIEMVEYLWKERNRFVKSQRNNAIIEASSNSRSYGYSEEQRLNRQYIVKYLSECISITNDNTYL